MTIDPNDPRLTAFVLGELDPTEHANVEAYLDRICGMPTGRSKRFVRRPSGCTSSFRRKAEAIRGRLRWCRARA